MNIVMITLKRQVEDYIHETLRRLFSSDWTEGVVHLVVGSGEQEHLRQYEGHPRIVVHPWDKSQWGVVDGEMLSRALDARERLTRPCRRFNVGLAKAVALSICPAIFSEDDVGFKETWVKSLQDAVARIRSLRPTGGFVLNAAGNGTGSVESRAEGIRTGGKLIGSQLLYFDSFQTQLQCAEWMLSRHTQHSTGGCSDVLIGQWANQYAALYHKKIVYHLGQWSCFHAGLKAKSR